ncbi:MAG TPA: prepilin-type N-terminal cleavage/methylation domain-containing protein [Polyangiaceae bacterium]
MSKIKGSSAGLPAWCRGQARGVTLIELMIVVAMVGVLAALATVGYKRYISSAKTGEATQMLGTIKAAQEAFKAETFRYLAVTKDLDTFYPQDDREIGTDKYAWEGGKPASAGDNFQTLGVNSTGPVLFGYACMAGSASDDLPDLPLDFDTPDWPSPGGPWYVAVAKGDLDGDGNPSGFMTSSLHAEIISIHAGE